ncbi:MAG: hypothetical protein FJ276_36020, partial [Planctomycetes bacterium]|nr:hypothetical protein [Planctomycetota bacterium]
MLAKGGALQSGLDLGYHVPTNQLNIVKHGFWNEMEAVGTPGEAKVIENDQAWLDCESTTVTVTPDGPMFSPEFMARWRANVEEAERRAMTDEIRTRVQRAKLSLLYAELGQRLGYFTEFGDFSYGSVLAASRAERKALQPMLDEFCGLCKQFGITHLGIVGGLDRVTGKWQTCIDAESPARGRVFLPGEWIFVADPRDQGLTDRWFAQNRYYDATAKLTIGEDQPLPTGMARVHINRGVGWEQQGFPGLDGYGWYFQNLEAPQSFGGKEHLYLYLRMVNEQAW